MTTENKELELEKDEFVPKKAFSEVTMDMHKYKEQLKQAQAALNQLKAEKDLQDIEEKKQKEQWEELYKSESSKREQLERERSEERNKFLNYHKKQAVISKIGGFKRDEYSSFINVDSVQVDDNGNVVSESLDAEINRIKQNFPDLLKASAGTPLPIDAPRKSFEPSVDFKNMTEREKKDFRMSLLTKK